MLMGEGYGINSGSGDYTNKEAPVQTSVLSFLRSGNYNYGTGGLSNRGSNGYYWSSRTYATTGSYDLHFRSAGLGFANGDDKGFGFTLRCVIR